MTAEEFKALSDEERAIIWQRHDQSSWLMLGLRILIAEKIDGVEYLKRFGLESFRDSFQDLHDWLTREIYERARLEQEANEINAY